MAKAKKSKPAKAAKAAKPAKKDTKAKKPAVKAKAKAAPVKKVTQSKKAAPVKGPKKPIVKAKAPAKAVKPLKAAPKAVAKVAEKPVVKGKAAAPTPSTLKGKTPAKIDKEKVEKAEKLEKKYEGKTPEMVEAQLLSEFQAESEDIVLTDAEGRKYCRAGECDQLSLVDGYCRYHYLFFWKKIQIRKKILSEGKLGRYVEELTSRYPDKFLDILRKDLRSEKDFLAAIQELEMEDGSEEGGSFEDESSNFADEVRGLSSDTPARSDEEF